jgi:hypothetical protein
VGQQDGEAAVTWASLSVGDRVRFHPQRRNAYWIIRARDERFIVATRQAAFHPRGTLEYTVVDLTGWTHEYNGVRAGIARSSINQIGGGYGDGSYSDQQCHLMLAELQEGTWELSVRRVVEVDGFTTRALER